MYKEFLKPDTISTQGFKITKNDFYVLISSNGYRKYDISEIRYLDLTYGSIAKNRILTTVFGVGCLFMSAIIDYYSASIDTFIDFINLGKAGIAVIMMILGFSTLCISAFYHVLKTRAIMKVEFLDGRKEIFRLDELVNRHLTMKLLKVVSGNLTKKQLRLNQRLVEDILGGTLAS